MGVKGERSDYCSSHIRTLSSRMFRFLTWKENSSCVSHLLLDLALAMTSLSARTCDTWFFITIDSLIMVFIAYTFPLALRLTKRTCTPKGQQKPPPEM